MNFTDAKLSDSDLTGAVMSGCNLHGADLSRADLRGADLGGVADWKSIAGVQLANIHGVRNAPEGFVVWVISKGAVDVESDSQWNALLPRDDGGEKK